MFLSGGSYVDALEPGLCKRTGTVLLEPIASVCLRQSASICCNIAHFLQNARRSKIDLQTSSPQALLVCCGHATRSVTHFSAAFAERGSRLARNTPESCAISGFARRADCFGEKVLLFPAESFVHFFAIQPVFFAFVQSAGEGIILDRT